MYEPVGRCWGCERHFEEEVVMVSAESDANGRLAAEELARDACRDLFEAAPQALREKLGLRVEEVGGALVFMAPGTAGVLLNRTLGLGVRAPATPDHISEIRRLYADAEVGRYFVPVAPMAAPGELPDWLQQQGLQPQRRWMKFERDARPAPASKSQLTATRIDAAHARELGRIVTAGFDMGEAAAELFPPLVSRPGWHLFGAFEGSELAGAGVLYVHGRRGYFAFAATAPAHRKKGAQSALLTKRIEAARELGCVSLFTETGEEVPGDPQHSYHNIERAGFEARYLLDNYAPPR
jgi:GNAT superfamily N-acetyltransferase